MSLLPVVMPERAVALILAVGWALVLFLGQGLLIGLVVAAMLRALRDRSADVRYGVACAGLLVMAVCPVVATARGLGAAGGESSPRPSGVAAPIRLADREGRRDVAEVPLPGGDGVEAVASAAAPAAQPVWRDRVEAGLPMVVAAWLIGVCVLAMRLVKGLVDVRVLTRRGLLGPTDEIQAAIGRLVERAGLRRPICAFLSARVEVPTVVGWLRPRVLIPVGSLVRLTFQQLEALLAHEIAHIRRHDYLVNIGQIVVEGLLFFHPAVWWVSRRIRIERENCCDDMAVALCGGDRLLLARALFAIEEQRGTPILRVAASGGSLRDRVRRLVLPSSSIANPAEAGWAGAGLIAAAVGLIVVAWLAGSSHARDDAPRGGKSSVHGRVLDEAGKPIAGVRMRLYRRESRSDRHHAVIEESETGPGGAFRLNFPFVAVSSSHRHNLPPYVLLADQPGKAVGWRTIPETSTTFEGDLILTAPTERTITVVDADGRPVQEAKVNVNFLGDASSPSPLFRDALEVIRPDDGPLTAIADASGRATFRQLPRTSASFVATKPGFAEGFAFREQGTIHLSPSAALSGSVTGPDGKPLGGIKVVMYTTFLWSFEKAVTDDQGRYHFANLKAHGWDMTAWGAHLPPGNGMYKVWIESERFAVPTQTITLEPKTHETLDLQAEVAGVIRATVTDEGTDKPISYVRITGLDQATGSSGRFDAYTDDQGMATFFTTPARLSLSIAGPPEGYYIKGDLHHHAGSTKQIDFRGGEAEVRLSMPAIAGRLITVSGVCTRPDGSPAAGASVSSAAGHFVTSVSTNLIRMRRADGAGRFTLEGVPAGQTLHLYAETGDRQLAGTATVRMPDEANHEFRLNVPMVLTVVVDIVFQDSHGKPLPSRKFLISPKEEQEDFPFLRRTVESDAEGRVKVDGIVPGLSYRVQEEVPPQQRQIAVPVGGRLPWYDEVLVLAPKEGK